MLSKLEIIAFNIASCQIAQEQGADRIELCDNPAEGGTTPSLGFIEAARQELLIDLFPMIRPRGGDFLYSDAEYAIMKKDVLLCKQTGCNGVVIGMLLEDGSIDKKRVKGLVQLAYPMSVTFHRAFDRASKPFQALEDIIDTGCERILSSGQRTTAMEGMDLIKQLLMQADRRIIIMPGAGIRSETIEALARQTGAEEFHASARATVASNMKFAVSEMQEELNQIICDGDEVKRMVSVLKKLKAES